MNAACICRDRASVAALGGTGGARSTLSDSGISVTEFLGSFVGNTRDLQELVELVKEGKVQLPEVEKRPLDAAEESLRDLAAGKVVGRIVLEMTG